MLSFSKVVFFAAVAFGSMSQAIQLSPREVSVGARAQGSVQLKGLLTDLNAQVVVAIAPINSLTPKNATAPLVLPILEDINGILSDVANFVEDLAAEPVGVLLEDVNDVLLTADVVFCLVRDVLNLVFEVLEIVSQLFTGLSDLSEILLTLISTITVLLRSVIKSPLYSSEMSSSSSSKIQAFVSSSLVIGHCRTFISL